MALSNWDTLAVDLTGKSIPGSFVSPLGVKVEIYKNWIYIHDSKAWRDGGSYVEDTVMEIHKGSLTYLDVHVEAKRGPQNGIYFVCYCCDYPKKDETRKTIYTGMLGCGVYGFNDTAWIGVTKEGVEFLNEFVAGLEYKVPEEITKVQIDATAMRYNQGDAYFADKLGMDIPATAVGEVDAPMLIQAIDKDAEAKT